jgi:hypothetical protein
VKTYTVDNDFVYLGFDKHFTIDTDLVAICMIEGELEIWALEAPEYVRELDRFYSDQFGYEGTHFKIMTLSGFWSNPHTKEQSGAVKWIR